MLEIIVIIIWLGMVNFTERASPKTVKGIKGHIDMLLFWPINLGAILGDLFYDKFYGDE